MATLSTIRPGDMLGFCPPWHDPLGAAINLGSLGIPGRGLSHVGLVADVAVDGAAVTCLYESTTTFGKPCLVRGEVVEGVQCHPVADRVRGYRGRVWRYPLRRRISDYEAVCLEERLRKLCVNECPYDTLGALRSRSMVGAAVMRWKFYQEDIQELFCSELVANEWALMRILKTRSASRWNPNSLARYAVRHGLTFEPTEIVLPPESIPDSAGRTA